MVHTEREMRAARIVNCLTTHGVSIENASSQLTLVRVRNSVFKSFELVDLSSRSTSWALKLITGNFAHVGANRVVILFLVVAEGLIFRLQAECFLFQSAARPHSIVRITPMTKVVVATQTRVVSFLILESMSQKVTILPFRGRAHLSFFPEEI